MLACGMVEGCSLMARSFGVVEIRDGYARCPNNDNSYLSCILLQGQYTSHGNRCLRSILIVPLCMLLFGVLCSVWNFWSHNEPGHRVVMEAFEVILGVS